MWAGSSWTIRATSTRITADEMSKMELLAGDLA